MAVLRCQDCGDVHCGLPAPPEGLHFMRRRTFEGEKLADVVCGTWPVEDWPGPLPERHECERCDECGKPHAFTSADVVEIEQNGCRFLFKFMCPDTEFPEGDADAVVWTIRNYFVNESTGEEIFPTWTPAKDQPAAN